MSKTNTWENDLVKLVFLGTAITGLAQNAASPVTQLYVSLHDSDPGEAGNQSTNEISYTGYARRAVPRNAASGWAITGGAVANTAAITFGACTGGAATASHFGVGMSSSGAGTLLYKGALTSSLAISNGITPEFAAGNLDIEEQ